MKNDRTNRDNRKTSQEYSSFSVLRKETLPFFLRISVLLLDRASENDKTDLWLQPTGRFLQYIGFGTPQKTTSVSYTHLRNRERIPLPNRNLCGSGPFGFGGTALSYHHFFVPVVQFGTAFWQYGPVKNPKHPYICLLYTSKIPLCPFADKRGIIS